VSGSIAEGFIVRNRLEYARYRLHRSTFLFGLR